MEIKKLRSLRPLSQAIFNGLLILCFLLPEASFASLKTKDSLPEFPSDSLWVGSPPLTRKDLEGKTVLLYFWNFSSPAGAREIPALNNFQEKYVAENFKIIGIHIPEFEYEKIAGEVQKAYQRFKINHPLVLDTDKRLYSLYGAPPLPSCIFIDANQRIRNILQGEGRQEEMETWILKLLTEKDLSVDIQREVFEKSPPHPLVTKDSYFGFSKSPVLGNSEALHAGILTTFHLPESLEKDRPYLEGTWRAEPEFLRLENGPASLRIRLKAHKVYLVAGSKNSTSPHLEMTYEGKPLNAKLVGKDTHLTKEAKSVLLVSDYRLYEIFDSQLGFQEGLLEIKFQEEGVDLYEIAFR